MIFSIAVSFAAGFEPARSLLANSFLPWWHEFALGILACLCVLKPSARRIGVGLFVCGSLALIGSILAREATAVAAATALLVIFLGLSNRLGAAGNWRLIQFVGERSYSIYLLHTSCIFVLLGAYTHLGRFSVLYCLLFSALAVGATMVAASLLYRFVERPSIGWSRRI